jgi:predicted ester cyclase
VKQVVIAARKAFPDLKVTIDDMIGEGDKVCARLTTRGTHKGTFFDVPASGKSIAMKGFTMIRIVDRMLVESWVQNDVMGLMSQIGAGSKNRLD